MEVCQTSRSIKLVLILSRKHLFSDLQPYNCFYRECHFNTTAFTNLQTWKNHLEFEHNCGPAWEAIKCPLCLDLTGDGKSAILTHFARHMEDIALLALPAAVESDAESDTSIDTPFDINGVEPTPPRESEPARSPSNPPSSPHLNAQPRPQPCVPQLNWESGDPSNLQEISEFLDMEIRECEQNPSKWVSKEWPVKQKIRELLDKKVHELEQESITEGSEEWQHLRGYVQSITKLLSKKIREHSAKTLDDESEEPRNLQKIRKLWDEKRPNDGQEPPGRANYVRYPIKGSKRTFEGDTTIINGYLQLESFAGSIYLVVLDQNEPHNQLLREQLSKGIEYRRAGEATLLCTQKNGTELLLDFQDPEGCESVWIHIREAIDYPIHAHQIDSTEEPRELACPPHTNLTTPSEHAPNSPSIAGGNELLPESLEEPFLPASQPYLWPSDSEPKSPSLNPDLKENHPDMTERHNNFPINEEINYSMREVSPEPEATIKDKPQLIPQLQYPLAVSDPAATLTSEQVELQPAQPIEVAKLQRTKREHICPYCAKIFTKKFNFESHLATHGGSQRLECPHCDKTYVRDCDLTRHIRLHHVNSTVTCGGVLPDGRKWGCGTNFARLDILRRHHKSRKGKQCLAERDSEE